MPRPQPKTPNGRWLLPLLPDNRQLVAEAMTPLARHRKAMRGRRTVTAIEEYLRNKQET